MTDALFTDEPHVERISRALWSREPSGTAAMLVGAGFSRNAVSARAAAGTMPGWNDMYVEMVDDLYPVGHPASEATRQWLLGQTGATSAYLRVAEEYEAQFRRDGLDKLILRYVPDQQFEPGDLHRQLLQLPWADVMTTNWDTLLERAAETVEDRVYDVIRTADEIPEARAPRIVKLHGSLPANRPFIFTEEDFRTYPVRFAPFVNLAQQLAMENTLVLMGFSGDDPNFLYWSGWVRDRLGAKAPLIYLVGALDLSASKRKMLEARAVQPVDLSRLPQFASWPGPLRVQNANRWFLERLRASEPYPARRWPRPQAGFSPPLTLTEPKPDPSAPPSELDLGIDSPAAKIDRLIDHCRRLRLVYPGWVVPPLDTIAYVWNRLSMRLREAVSSLAQLSPERRLEALYELDWQLQTVLVPLSLTLSDEIKEILDELEHAFGSLDEAKSGMFRALALSAVRHAREEGEDALFVRWADWLVPHVEHYPEERERLFYERCLRHRANLEIDELETAVTGWTIEGDPYWHVRKAGLLSDLGRHDEAKDLSLFALNEIRLRTTRGMNDIASWSRESYAMLLRSTFLHGDLGSWTAHKAVRDRFDQRQDLLEARGCTGRQDFFGLVEALNQVPPPLQSSVERTTRFDIGSSHVKFRFAGSQPAERRLLAYKTLRYLDETGLPSRIENVGVGAQLLEHAARWLIDVDPNRAVDALMRGSANPGTDSFEQVFNRSTVALSKREDAEHLIAKLLRMAETAYARVDARGAAKSFWQDRLKVAVELISRFVLVVPERASDALHLAMKLQRSSLLAHSRGIPGEIAKLISRSVEAMSDVDAAIELPKIFASPVPPDPNDHEEAFDAVSAVPRLGAGLQKTSEWVTAINIAIDAASQRETRLNATRRLNLLRGANLLDETEEGRFGQALWKSDFLVDGLPSGTIFHPVAFLRLPAPAGIDVRHVVANALLAGELNDEIVSSGAMSSLIGSDEFILSEPELLGQIARLHRFIEQHAPAPAHPNIMGDRRADLIENTSFIFADLARRSVGIEQAVALIAELIELKRHPLRIEPSIPALVTLKLMDATVAMQHIRAMFSAPSETSNRLIQGTLEELLHTPEPCGNFEEALWRELAATLVARRPVPLAACLDFLASALRRCPERVPASIDEQVTLALELILAETTPGRASEHLLYEPFLVRFRAATLAARLQMLGRGGREMLAAWQTAIDADTLPDVRWAWEVGSRSV